MRRFLLLLSLPVLMAFAGRLPAQDRAEMFAQLDANRDGYVALDEVPAEHQAKFKRLLKLAGKENEQKLNRALFEGATRADRPRSDAGSAPATAEAKPARAADEQSDLFARLDANGDGVVAASEVKESQREAFQGLLKNGDINSDGQLSREEYAASTKATETPPQPGRGAGAGGFRAGGPPINPGEMFARMDRNQDGKLSKDEAPPRIQENFDRVDASGDGSLSPEEFGRAAGVFGQRLPPGAGGGPPPGMPPAGLFVLLDTDKDGEISTSEIVGAGSVLLKLDRNGDGKLTPDEVFAGGAGRLQRPPND